MQSRFNQEDIGARHGAVSVRRISAMKMSHLANFLLMIVGGAVQEVSSVVRRKLRGAPRTTDTGRTFNADQRSMLR